MPEFCSCGAQLPNDALFCHKCGKAQRDIVVPEPIPTREEAPPPVVAVSPAPALNFHNPVAIRIALMVAVTATALGFVVPLLNWPAAGFFAVWFYSRRTGSLLNVGAGAKLGWITGVLMFGPWALIFAAQQFAAARSGKLAAQLQDQLTRNMPAQDPAVQQMINMVQSGPGLIAAVVFALIALFFFITGLSMAGGALGAKMTRRT
jgi:hypothetical protein